jgi:hypothetical protein
MHTRSHVIKIPFWHTISTRTLFYLLTALLITVFGYYAYLINRTVMNVVARENTEREIAALSGTIGELEFEYITLRNAVTLELAHAKGFQDATPTQFISRAVTIQSLSYNRPQ